MLGISFSEFFIVVLVACVVMRPKDVPKVINFFKTLYKHITKLKKEVFSYYDQIQDEIAGEDESNYIIDDNGTPQRAYDISELKHLQSSKQSESVKVE